MTIGRRRQIDDHADLEREQRRRPPAEFAHWADDEVLNGDREDVLKVADDARDVRDDILRKQDAVERARAHAHAQRFRIETAIESEQSANADKREAEAQLNRHELRGDEDEQRETRASRPAFSC